MTDQQKLFRVFTLIRLLSQPPYRTIPQLAKLLEVSDSTTYRYIKLLESLNYLIDKDERNRYFLYLDFKNDQDLVSFEEAGYLQDMLWQMPAGNPHRERLLHKLNRQYTLAPLVQSQVKFQVYEHIRSLGHALEGKLRVQLLNYLNAKGELSNRYIEPVEFQEGYTYIYAFDLDRQAYRQFKIERINQVVVLSEPIRQDHGAHITDIFGLTGPNWLPVKLWLSTRAQQLLLEERPAARPFVSTRKGRFLFDGMVRHFQGIGRFVLGLPGEIEVEESDDFRDYLRGRVEEFNFKKAE